MNIDFSKLLENVTEVVMNFAPRLLLALVVLIVGFWLIGRVTSFLRKKLDQKEYDKSLVSFLGSITGIILKAALLVSVAGMVGVETASFIAILGAAGLAIGLALQGSLANFAAGVMILIFKPFRVGDVIEAQGEIASVSDIQIFHTVLKSFDNKTIILPNGPLYNNKIINYSTEPNRKVQWIFGIGYQDNIDKARAIIADLIHTDSRVLDGDQPYIMVNELADSSINLKVRALVSNADFWDVFYEKNESVKKAFDEQGISIPYPQMDAHIYQK